MTVLKPPIAGLLYQGSLEVSNTNPLRVMPESGLITDNGGPSRRVRVDLGQTSFFAGREFRTFKEFSLTAGTSYVVKVVAAVDTIIFDLSVTLITGEIKLYTITGGTEGGSYSEALPIIDRNSMVQRPTPYYTSQNVLTAGGTQTGGTILDLLWAKTSGNSEKASNIGVEISDERGISPGTYYFKLTAVSDSTGVLSSRWEERV